jgi:hypothetical protein
MEPQTMEQMPIRKASKTRNDANKIRKRYLNIGVRDTGQYIRRISILQWVQEFLLCILNKLVFCLYNNVCNYREAELYSMWWIKEPTWWEGNKYDGNAE